jgi:hypothetical protein
MSPKNLLILFAKNPDTEPVKTRLAKSIGSGAREVYEQMLLKSIHTHAHAPYDFKVYILGDKSYFQGLVPKADIVVQRGKNLGDRMFHAFEAELELYQRVMITGSDVLLSRTFVTDAFGFETCVIGPCPDGGYYLIGLTRPEDIFTHIPWSTSQVYEKTRYLIQTLGLPLRVLEQKRDLDDIEDYQYYLDTGLIKPF